MMFFLNERLAGLKNTRTFVLKEKERFFDTLFLLLGAVMRKDRGMKVISNIINNFKGLIL